MTGEPVTFGFVLWWALVACLAFLFAGLLELAVRWTLRRRSTSRALRDLRERQEPTR